MSAMHPTLVRKKLRAARRRHELNRALLVQGEWCVEHCNATQLPKWRRVRGRRA